MDIKMFFFCRFIPCCTFSSTYSRVFSCWNILLHVRACTYV